MGHGTAVLLDGMRKIESRGIIHTHDDQVIAVVQYLQTKGDNNRLLSSSTCY